MGDQNDYKSDVKIDIDSLDWEWMRQPSLYMQYAELEASANKRVKDIKQQVEVLRAQIYCDVVKGEEKKPTDKAIDAFVQTDPEYKDKVEELNQAIYEAEILQSAVNALNQKKSALENLVKLLLGQYFAGPKEPHSTDQISIRDRVVDDADKKQRQNLNKNKTKKGEE